MKKIFLPLLAVLIVFAGCKGGDQKKAYDFNEKLAAISYNLEKKGRAFGAELQPAMQSNDFSKLASITDSLEKFIDEKTEELKNTKDVGGSEKLRSAMLEFMAFEKDMVKDAFLPFSKLNASSTEEDKQAAIQNLMKRSQEEGKYLTKVQEAQKEYADKHGFKLERKTY